MLYERSLEIERRLQTVLELIHTGDYSTPALAEEVGVSIPTISRMSRRCARGDIASAPRIAATDGDMSSSQS